MRTTILIIASLILLSVTILVAAQSGADLLQQGMVRERANGDIQGAIQLYERVVKEFPRDRLNVATALLRLGLAYDKLGQEVKAQQYYEQAVGQYSDQTNIAAQAREHLKIASSGAAAAPPVRIEFGLPAGQSLSHAFRHAVELSPDGTRVAFVASPTFDVTNPRFPVRIYIKRVDQFSDAVAVEGTQGGYNPFFSPDGQWLGFFWSQNGPLSTNPREIQIRKVPVSGGSPTTLLTQTGAASGRRRDYGATWGSDGTIVFGGNLWGLRWIPEGGATGETGEQLTELDSAANERGHLLPHSLPDGSGVLFTVRRNSEYFKDAQIWVYSPKTRMRKLLIENAVDARYAGNNQLMFAREGKLFSVPFDLKTLSVTGPQSPAADGEGVSHAVRYFEEAARTGAAQYSVSLDGSLVYAPGSEEPQERRSVVFVDSDGRATSLEGVEPRQYTFARVSPDGRYILIGDAFEGVRIYETETKTLKGPFDSQGTVSGDWSPDGTRFILTSVDGQLYWGELGSPNITQLAANYIDAVWAPDGRLAVVAGRRAGSPLSIALLSVDKPGDVQPWIGSDRGHSQYPAFSPDGHWVAYNSNKTGANSQIFVQPYPGPGPEVLVPDGRQANTVVQAPVWSRDGQQLFHLNPLGGLNPFGGAAMMAARFNVIDGQFVPESPRMLFTNRSSDQDRIFTYSTSRSYDVMPDGRFVMIQQNIAADTLERNQKIFPTSLRLIPAANKPTRISLGAGPADPTAQTGPGSRGFQISVVDRQGKVLNTLGDFIAHRWLSLSPDGNRVLFMTPQPNMHVTDLSTGVKTNLSGTYFNGTPVWSPDGARVAYPRGPGSAGMQLVVRSSDLSGREDLVYSGLAFSSGLYQWSPDGQFILMSLRSGPVALRVTDKKLLPILNGVASAAAFRISPDNRFIAYVSKESGRNPYPEVWVRPFDPSSDNPTSSPQKWQVSNEEAVGMVRWRNDGKELYYVAYRSSTVMAVPISTTPEFKAGTPTPLFKLPAGSIQFSDSPGLAADISGDGQRFVFLVPAGARVTNTPTR